MSKAFTSEETELPPDVHARPPPSEPRPLDPARAAQLNDRGVIERGAHVRISTGAWYWLVAPEEANPALGRLSIDSPLGRALLGKRKGDDVRLSRPRDEVDYEILDVRY